MESFLRAFGLPSFIDVGPLDDIIDMFHSEKPWQCVYTYTSDSGPGVPEPYPGPEGYPAVRYHMVDYDPDRC